MSYIKDLEKGYIYKRLEKGYSEKMLRKQVLRNISRNILQELHFLLTPDQERKKVFQDIPVVGFCNGKSLKDHLVSAKLTNVEIRGTSESCGKRNFQVCDFICDAETFSTKA